MTPGTIVVSGAVAQRPFRGGHTWVFLQYLLGFRRLGWEVLFLDWLDASMAVDGRGRPCPEQDSVNVRYLRAVLDGFELGDSYSLLSSSGAVICGLPRADVLRRTAAGAVLLNVMGYLGDAEILASVERRVYLDIDPGFAQMWEANGLYDGFAGHDDFVTVGLGIGDGACVVPTGGRRWIPTVAPVVLDLWPVAGAATDPRVTSVASWRGTYAPVDYGGRTYGLRVHEFRRFAAVPRHSSARFELALDIGAADAADARLLTDGGWALVDPLAVAAEPCAYRDYIQGSAAELMVAKNLYVAARTGWFSDRSACYLASGKPVLAQDTGLTDRLPLGQGLLTFTTPDEAVDAVAEVMGNHARHALAARAVAETCFDSDVVLGTLLTALGIG